MTEKCAAAVYYPGSWRSARCNKPGKFEEDGKWYCGIHNPAKIRARKAANQAKWDGEWNRKVIGWRLEEALKAIGRAALTGPVPEALIEAARKADEAHKATTHDTP